MKRRPEKSKSILPMVVILIFLGALSIGAGYLGGQYLLRGFGSDRGDPAPVEDPGPEEEPSESPVEPDIPEAPDETDEAEEDDEPADDTDDAEEDPDEDEEEVPPADYRLTGSRLELYRVQAGVFTLEENARSLLDELRDLGVGGVVIRDGEDYRVVVDLAYHEADARELEDDLLERDYEILVTSWEMPAFEAVLSVGEVDGFLLQQFTEDLEKLLAVHGGVTPDSGRSTAEEIRVLAEAVAARLGEVDADLVPPAYRAFIIDHLESHLALARNEPGSGRCHESYLRLAWAFRAAREGLD